MPACCPDQVHRSVWGIARPTKASSRIGPLRAYRTKVALDASRRDVHLFGLGHFSLAVIPPSATSAKTLRSVLVVISGRLPGGRDLLFSSGMYAGQDKPYHRRQAA